METAWTCLAELCAELHPETSRSSLICLVTNSGAGATAADGLGLSLETTPAPCGLTSPLQGHATLGGEMLRGGGSLGSGGGKPRGSLCGTAVDMLLGLEENGVAVLETA